MSRGERATVGAAQNLSSSMRQNYDEYGVDEYYKKVGATYRNPHYPGIRSCLFSWFNKWSEIEEERNSVVGEEEERSRKSLLVFDMACGSGEVTEAIKDWYTAGIAQWKLVNTKVGGPPQPGPSSAPSKVVQPPLPISRKKLRARALGPSSPHPYITAADPYTADAYHGRISLPCATLSFKDIGEGILPTTATNLVSGESLELQARGKECEDAPEKGDSADEPLIEVVICSFALHLIQSPSELFTLLWELSTKARWLVILAPHKKPEIKDGWGWMKWDVAAWSEAPMLGQTGELLNDRVHCRTYKSTHFA